MGNELVASIILIVMGVVFFFNNKAMGEGCFGFYRWLYTKRNLKIMFKIAGIILIVGGILLAFLK
jgi:hypothetical protein